MPVLAHAGRPDELVAELLLVAALALAWVGVGRLRGRRFPGLARWVAWGLAGGSVALAVLAVLLPTAIWREPAPAVDRPTSPARIEILTPTEGQAIAGTSLHLVTRLVGGTVVDPTETEVRPDTGHVHVYLDDRLVSMTYAPEQEIPLGDLERGPHVLRVEFVAADHGPFDPPVEAAVRFVKLTD